MLTRSIPLNARHLISSASYLLPAVMEEVARQVEAALETVASRISGVVPESIHESVSKAINTRIPHLSD
ncbi:hypothetical protein [Haloferula sargassicola]